MSWVLLGAIGLAAVALVMLIVGIVLMVTGSPRPCVDRVSAYSAAASQALRADWLAFEAESALGSTRVTVTEVGATSRGAEYVSEKDLPVKDLQVYFCPDGHAEAAARIEIAGVDARVVVEGTLDVSGELPRLQVDRVRFGNLPSAVGTRAVDFILDRGGAKTLGLQPRITGITYADGTATVSGAPR